MIVVKYAIIGCLVTLGIVAFNKRDDITHAFHWSPVAEKQALPAFDPKAVAEANALPVPKSAITVTNAPDTRTVTVASVPTGTTAPLKVTGGRSTLDGVVTGPGGVPVAGATVHIERLVDGRSASLNVTSNAGGGFSVGQLLGGRYRVRAWRTPTHAQAGSEVTFVEDGQRHSFRLEMEAPTGVEFTAGVDNDKVIIGQATNIITRVRAPFVNELGQVSIGGRPADVITVTANGVFTGQGGTKATDGSGLATFPLTCGQQTGTGVVTITGVGQTKTFTVNCVPVPTTTTTTTTTTTVPGGATTTLPATSPATSTTKAG